MLDDVFSFLFFLLLRIIIVVIGIVFVVTCMEDLICIIASFLLIILFSSSVIRLPPVRPRAEERGSIRVGKSGLAKMRSEGLHVLMISARGVLGVGAARSGLWVGRGCWACVLILVFFEGLRRCFFQQGVLLCFVVIIVLLAYPSFIVLYPIHCFSHNSMIVYLFPGSPPNTDMHCFRSLFISSPITIHRFSTCPPFHS